MRQLFLCFLVVFLFAMWTSTVVAQTPPPSGSLNTDGQLTDAEKQQIRQPLSKTILVVGVVESADIVEIQSPISGDAIVVSLVPDGSEVKAGDLLVELDDAEIRRAIAEQRLKLAGSKAAAERAAAGIEKATDRSDAFLPYARLKLLAAEIARKRYLANDGEYALDVAHADRQIMLAENRLKVVEDQKRASPRSRDMDWAMDDAKAELRLVEDAKKLLTDHVREHETTILEAAIAEAKADLVQVEIDMQGTVQSARADAKAQQLAYELERERLDEMQNQLAHCRIIAPRDGVVVYTTSTAGRAPRLEPGAAVRERQPLMAIPNLDNLFIKVSINETQIARVKIGQSVTLALDAFPGQKISGHVTDVARVPVPKSSMNADAVEYDVHVTIDKAPTELRLGMSAMAEIHVDP